MGVQLASLKRQDSSYTGLHICSQRGNHMQFRTTLLCAALGLTCLATAHADTLSKAKENGQITLEDKAENLLSNEDVKRAYLGM